MATACINRARPATIRAASGNDNTPAATAAANSPTEWPSTTPGRTPHEPSGSANQPATRTNPTGPTASDPTRTRRNQTPHPGPPRPAPDARPVRHMLRQTRQRTPEKPSRAPGPSPTTVRPDRRTRTQPARDRGSRHHPRSLATGSQRFQPGQQRFAVRSQHHRPLLQRGPGGSQRKRRIQRGNIATLTQIGQQCARLSAERCRCSPRHDQRDRWKVHGRFRIGTALVRSPRLVRG